MSEQRSQDRRQRYSFRKHLNRLRQTGRLKQIGAVAAAAIVLAGISFARCQSSKITGPAETKAPQPSTGPSATTTVSLPKVATAIFPSDLLPKFNPCKPDLTFVEMSGQNDVTYTDQVTTTLDGQRQHTTTYTPHEKQNGKDSRGNAYAGDNPGQSKSDIWVFTTKGTFHTHARIKTADQNEVCNEVINKNGQHGNSCDFDQDQDYTYVMTEDPLTGEALMTVTPTSIVPSCPLIASQPQPAESTLVLASQF
jgi:hypothetical protein